MSPDTPSRSRSSRRERLIPMVTSISVAAGDDLIVRFLCAVALFFLTSGRADREREAGRS